MGIRAVPRPEVYETFWKFACERQRIFEQRIAGLPGPWTDDPILRTYKFCNAFRASDRVSQYLIRDVIYDGEERSAEDTVLRIVLFRLFSRERTWELIEELTGGLSVATFDEQAIGRMLDDEMDADRRIYTSAFILCANSAFGHARKHANHLSLISTMLKGGALWKAVEASDSLEAVYNALLAYPLIGPFMAYQIATDLNYSEVIDFSEDEFTVAGPGSERGIRKVFLDTGGARNAEIILDMVDRQEDACDELGLVPPTLFGRRLHAIDVQNLFCEVDKYCRVAFPELASNRTKIKATFVPSSAPLQLFYPPKWGVDYSGKVGSGARELAAAGRH